MTIEYLLRRAATTGDQRPLAVARRSLDAMADGGIHDQLGGGFHRYATDAIWLVPHFEQMLYDNAQLARAYIHAFALTGDERYRDGRRPGPSTTWSASCDRDDGTFAASQDADTDGVEGATFTWTAAEIREALGEDAGPFLDGLRRHRSRQLGGHTDDPVAGGPADRRSRADEARLAASRANAARAARVASPARARRQGAGRVERPRDRRVRRRRTLASRRRRIPGRRHACRGGDHRRPPATRTAGSADRGRTVDRPARASSRTTPTSPTACWRSTRRRSTSAGSSTARSLADAILGHFLDPAGGFFDTADDHETLVTRPKDVQDNAVPAGSSMAASVLLRLAALTGESRYGEAAERAIATVTPYLGRYPTGFANWLSAAHLAVEGIDELAIVGDPADPATRALSAVASEGFRPNLVLAVAADPATSVVPLLEGRELVDGRPTAYLCRGFTCRLPVTDPAALREQLAAVAAASG